MNNNRTIRRNAPQAARVMPEAQRMMPPAQSCPVPQCHVPAALLPVMAFVPVQELGDVYSECQALHTGTLFPALDKPFCGKGCR